MPTNPPIADTDLALDADGIVALENYCAAVVTGKLTDQMEELDREKLLQHILLPFIEEWIANEAQPPNPKLASENAQCRFQFKRGLRVTLPREVTSINDALRLAGIHQARRKLFAAYVRRQRRTSLAVSLTELQKHPDEDIAGHAKQLQQWLEDHDPTLLTKEDVVQLKDENKFLADLPKLALNAAEVLKVFRVFAPTVAFSDVAHGDAIPTVQARTKRLRVFENAARKVKCIVDGRSAHLFERCGRNWQKIGVRGYPKVSDARKFAHRMTTDEKAFLSAAKSMRS